MGYQGQANNPPRDNPTEGIPYGSFFEVQNHAEKDRRSLIYLLFTIVPIDKLR